MIPEWLQHILFAEGEYVPCRYRLFYRMEQAKFLLRTTDLTVKQIGIRIGFTKHPGHDFCRSFKKFEGCSPGEWRRQCE